MQKITLLQTSPSLLINRRSIDQRRHVKPPIEALVDVESESNAKITMTSGRAKRGNLMEEIIMEIIIIL